MKAQLWQEVVDLLGEQVDRESLGKVLSVLLTAEEQSDIASRLAIVRALVSGKETQREIAVRLGVSIAKVTRGSNYLKTLNQTETRLFEG